MQPNISIIVLDTLRQSTFKSIEQKHKKFKNLNFIRYDNCIAPSPWTLPSHASLFTGLYPSKHGAHETKKIKIPDIEKIKLKKPIFVKELKGYTSYAYVANPFITPAFGFNGFDLLHEEEFFGFGGILNVSKDLKPIIATYRKKIGISIWARGKAILSNNPVLFFKIGLSLIKNTTPQFIKAVTSLIKGWPIEKGGKFIERKIVQTNFKTPFFLFVNIVEAHEPYKGDKNAYGTFLKKFDSQLKKKLLRLYYRSSLKAYNHAYNIAKHLIDKYGENQIIIVTSDHGQAFLEHDFLGHDTVLYDEVIRVPFLLFIGKNVKTSSNTNIKKYISLVNVKDFVISASKGKCSLDKLFSNKVYAESFGFPSRHYPTTPNVDIKKLKRFDQYKKRVFN